MSRKRRQKQKGARGPRGTSGGADSTARGEPPATQPPDGEPEAPEAGKPRTVYDIVRENAEALIVAVILAIIIRHFAVEAFEIPTGSMAPTLYGMNVLVDCPNCPTRYSVAIKTDSSSGRIVTPFSRQRVYRGPCATEKCAQELHSRRPGEFPFEPNIRITCGGCGKPFNPDLEEGQFTTEDVLGFPARCPICHHEFRATAEKGEVSGGNKILVNKYAFALADPQRWDVIVFEFDQWKNYIKRLVGLPGERIQIFDGDLYRDGKILRKSEHGYVQDGMWLLVSDSDVEENGLNPVPAWSHLPTGGVSHWTRKQAGRSWTLNNAGAALPESLDYGRRFDNYVSYNNLAHGRKGKPRRVQVGDKKVAFRLTPLSGSGWVGAQIRDGDFTFQARVPVGEPGEAVIERLVNENPRRPDLSPVPHPSASRAAAPYALKPGETVEFSFENVDDRLAVRIGSDEILSLEYVSCEDVSSPSTANGELPQHLRILGVAEASFESIRVYQDLYYLSTTETAFGTQAWPGITLGERQYLALGDNSASSSDGRYWKYVPEKNLMGKALLVFWPARPDDWPHRFQWKFIR